MDRNAVLKLYKDILRYGQNLRFTDKKYFRYRIREVFKTNKNLTDQIAIDFHFKVSKIPYKALKLFNLLPLLTYKASLIGFFFRVSVFILYN